MKEKYHYLEENNFDHLCGAIKSGKGILERIKEIERSKNELLCKKADLAIEELKENNLIK